MTSKSKHPSGSPAGPASAARPVPAAPAATPGTSACASVAHGILRAIEMASRSRSGTGPGPDHRTSARYCYCVPMTLHIDDPRVPTTRVIRAATSNISVGGFAFIFDASLSVGSTIRAQFDSLPGKPQIAGLVRSCVHICGTQHRIGVEYQ